MTAPSKTAVDIGTLIESRPGVCGGSPVLKGTRMPVKELGSLHQQGMTAEDLLRNFPELEAASVYAALAYYFANKAHIEAEISDDARIEQEWMAEEARRRKVTKSR